MSISVSQNILTTFLKTYLVSEGYTNTTLDFKHIFSNKYFHYNIDFGHIQYI